MTSLSPKAPQSPPPLAVAGQLTVIRSICGEIMMVMMEGRVTTFRLHGFFPSLHLPHSPGKVCYVMLAHELEHPLVPYCSPERCPLSIVHCPLSIVHCPSVHYGPRFPTVPTNVPACSLCCFEASPTACACSPTKRNSRRLGLGPRMLCAEAQRGCITYP